MTALFFFFVVLLILVLWIAGGLEFLALKLKQFWKYLEKSDAEYQEYLQGLSPEERANFLFNSYYL